MPQTDVASGLGFSPSSHRRSTPRRQEGEPRWCGWPGRRAMAYPCSEHSAAVKNKPASHVLTRTEACGGNENKQVADQLCRRD